MGEPGVGKTALAYGLAARIEAGNVPERLAGCRIYELDLGNLLAGTQYRGDFEKRLKTIMEGIGREGHAIVYIDEIHNLIGAGRTGEGSMDASNMLKPYLETRGNTFHRFHHLRRVQPLLRTQQGTGTPLPADRHTGTEH